MLFFSSRFFFFWNYVSRVNGFENMYVNDLPKSEKKETEARTSQWWSHEYWIYSILFKKKKKNGGLRLRSHISASIMYDDVYCMLCCWSNMTKITNEVFILTPSKHLWKSVESFIQRSRRECGKRKIYLIF